VNHNIKVYQASSSEMFGGGEGQVFLNENSMFAPKCQYAAAKMYAHNMGKIYRESYGMHISNGILFNHESPRRGENFVSKKITKAVARISKGQQNKLFLGNIYATRDWGHARDYMKAVRLMLEAANADDYVVSTRVAHSVQQFVELAFGMMNLDVNKYLEIDEDLFRPNEVKDLLGDPSKIREALGWEPATSFEALVQEMLAFDLEDLK